MGLRAPSDGDADGDAEAGDFVHTLASRVGTRHNPAFPRLTLTAAAHSTILQIQRHDAHRPDAVPYVWRGASAKSRGRAEVRMAARD